MTVDDVTRIIEEDPWMMQVLENVRSLDLPDSWVGAGFIRAKVWDFLHNYESRTPIPDIDVIYFRKSPEAKGVEEKYEQRLSAIDSSLRWSVKNQAKMHHLHDDNPYKNSEDALAHWVETATCIAVRIDDRGKIIIVAPYGIEDLVNLIVRPTIYYKDKTDIFRKRVEEKKWLNKWPKIKILL